MPVNILITSRKFFNEYNNDVGFGANLGDFTTNLAGSIMENIKMVLQVDVSWLSKSSTSDRFPINTVNSTITRVSGNFLNDGAAIGDTFDFVNINFSPPGSIMFNGTIQSISAQTIVYSVNSGVPIATTLGYGDAEIRYLTPLTASIYKFGLLDNSESFNVESKVSGNDQGYYSGTVGLGGPRSTAFQTMIRLGQFKDWQTGSMRIRYVSNPTTYVQRFEIEHIFMIVPYYLDGELSNLQNNVIPNLLNGLNSLKYAFSPGFRTVLSNPNTEKIIVDNSNNLGSVAWYNENFNGFQNNYQVNSITYEESATTNSADGLLIGTKTKVKIQVEALNRVFVVGDKVAVYVSYLPDEIEYQNTVLTDLKANFLYDRAFQLSGATGGVGDDFITAFAVFSPAGNIMNLEFQVEYSPTQKSFLSNKLAQGAANFLIAVELGDKSLASGSSDRLLLLADVEAYDESPDIPNLIENTVMRFHPHNVPITPSSGFSSIVQWNEDGFANAFRFDLNLNKSAVIQTLEFQLVAHNPVTGQFFVLDSYTYANIGNAVVSAGVQQLFENTTRGYNLIAGDQFNLVTITTGPNVAGLQEYSGVFAQKISWQDWLANTAVDPVFFDALKPNDNLNFKSSNYALGLQDYEIKMAIAATVDGVSVLNVSGTTSYLVLSAGLRIHDYDVDGNLIPIWSATIETFHPVTAVNLGGAILTGLDTVMKVTWVHFSTPVVSTANMYAIHRIEETDQPGYAIDEMSSILPQPVPNRVIPSVAQTQTTLTIVSGDVVSECLIDGTQIVAGQAYNLSARLDENPAVVGGGKVTETFVAKETETGVEKIIE